MIERKGDKARLVIEDSEGSSPTLKSDWWFDRDKEDNFVRWYARRNPEDDFAETFAYYLLGIERENPDYEQKYDFISDKVLRDTGEFEKLFTEMDMAKGRKADPTTIVGMVVRHSNKLNDKWDEKLKETTYLINTYTRSGEREMTRRQASRIARLVAGYTDDMMDSAETFYEKAARMGKEVHQPEDRRLFADDREKLQGVYEKNMAHAERFGKQVEAEVRDMLLNADQTDIETLQDDLEGYFDSKRGRINSYANCGTIQAYNTGKEVAGRDAGYNGGIWTEIGDEHGCEDCRGMAGKWMSYEMFDQVYGSLKCNGNCRCTLTEEEPDEDTEKILSVEDLKKYAGEEIVKALEFASTQVLVPPEISELVLAMGKEIPDNLLAEKGREDHPHITVKYGIHTSDSEVIRSIAGKYHHEVKAKLYTFDCFKAAENGGDCDVLILRVISPDLVELNKLISEETACTDTHPDYKPHMTIAYVKAGEGEWLVEEMRERHSDVLETLISFDSMMYSNREGEETKIMFGEFAKEVSVRNCPKCGELYDSTCRCRVGLKTCPNGHRWYMKEGVPVIVEKDEEDPHKGEYV